jgi:outer membrane protein TolC
MSSYSRFTLCRSIAGFLLALSFGFTPLSAQTRIGVPESQIPQLERLISSGITQSPRMIVRNAHSAAAEASLMVAKAARLPSFGMSGSWVASKEDRGDFAGTIPADKLYYSAVINQPLYQWGNISRSIKSAEIRKSMDDGRTRQAYLILANEIREKYLTLVQDRRNLEKNRFELKLANEDLAQGVEKRSRNIISDADIFQAELRQQRAAYQALRAEDSFIYSSEVLARLSGTEPLADSEVPQEFPAPRVQEDAPIIVSLLAHFLSAEMPLNTDLELALKQLEISQNDLHRERTALRPTVSLIAGVTSDEQSYDLNIANKYEVQSLYAGVSMNWTVFDGFASKGRVRAALANLRASEVELEVKKSAILTDAESYGRQFKSLALAVVITDRELLSAENLLADMKERLKRGEVSEAQVNGGQSQLHQAYGKALFERATYWSKLGDLLSLIEADPILNRVGP